MWKSVYLFISKPVYRREYIMEKYILKLIVIFSGISTGDGSYLAFGGHGHCLCGQRRPTHGHGHRTHKKNNYIFLFFR